ncbi:MAG: penicillin-binding protein 1B [Cellvibrionaceae bacterium]
MAKKARRSSKKKSSFFSRSLFIKLFLIFTALVAVWVVYLDFTVRAKFDGKKWAIPARVYAQPLELYEGLSLAPRAFESELRSLGYQFVRQARLPGQVAKVGATYSLKTKGFVFWDKEELSGEYKVQFDGAQVNSLVGADDLVLRLEPQEIGSIYPNHGEDRILTRLMDVPPLLGETLIAVEDKDFARHFGISFKGIARAMLANVKAGGLVQGGSTLTQQLVKNFYLTQERSLWRKVQEAVMSVLLELHYSKADILEAYINEVYLGQSGPRGIHGFGLASQHYFNRSLKSLKPHQIAMLIGVVKGASYYNPWRSPERTLKRRNLVLTMMAESQLIDESTLKLSLRQPLGVAANAQKQLGDYPAFLDLVKRQLQQDYKTEDLQSEGLRIFTTMSPQVQAQTEASVKRQMQRLTKTVADSLQTAAIVTAVGSGEILAIVGDRNPRYSGFNRALDAERQIGSLVKPFVYLTALMQDESYQLTSIVDDSELTVPLPNGTQWKPKNYSKESHGDLPLYQALAFSYNQSTARLGMDLGVDQVIKVLQRAGLDKDTPTLPSLLLGALALSPLEVSHLYHTLAADGVYTPLRSIRSVLDATDQPLQRYKLSSEPRFSPEHSHLMHYALQAVMRTGTGRSAYASLPSSLSVAGKTGTTNQQRDSWFAGYSGDHLGVVWVGNDDNQPTQLTGSSGALKIWTDMFSRLSTQSIAQTAPENIAYYWVDNQTGLRSAEGCDNAQLVPFVLGSEPEAVADCSLAKSGVKRWFNQWFR